MKLILEESELEELKIEDLLKSNDGGKVITPEVGKRGEGESDIVKEITAIDTINFGSNVAARINGVSVPSASKYGDGKDVGNEELKTKILSTKYNIQDTAVTKLMETLDLFDPTEMSKQTDIINAAQKLSSIVEKVAGGETKERAVHLHLYAPNQKKLKDYDIIDV